MGIFSRSSSGKHHKNGHYGNNHYQNKGLLGKVFDLINSRSHSHNNYNNNGQNYGSQNHAPSYSNNTICRKCNSQVPEGSKFCLNCGEKVATSQFCTNCGKTIPQNGKFCPDCGKKIGE